MICCDPVHVSFGPWLYVFCYQVKVMTDNELLGYACEQFLGKTVVEIKSVILQTLEGHLRSILGEWCRTLVSISNGTLLPSLWRIQTVCTVSFRSKFLPDEQHMTSNHSQQITQRLGHYVVKSFSAFTVHLENLYILYNGRLQSNSWSMKMRKHDFHILTISFAFVHRDSDGGADLPG